MSSMQGREGRERAAMSCTHGSMHALSTRLFAFTFQRLKPFRLTNTRLEPMVGARLGLRPGPSLGPKCNFQDIRDFGDFRYSGSIPRRGMCVPTENYRDLTLHSELCRGSLSGSIPRCGTCGFQDALTRRVPVPNS